MNLHIFCRTVQRLLAVHRYHTLTFGWSQGTTSTRLPHQMDPSGTTSTRLPHQTEQLGSTSTRLPHQTDPSGTTSTRLPHLLNHSGRTSTSLPHQTDRTGTTSTRLPIRQTDQVHRYNLHKAPPSDGHIRYITSTRFPHENIGATLPHIRHSES